MTQASALSELTSALAKAAPGLAPEDPAARETFLAPLEQMVNQSPTPPAGDGSVAGDMARALWYKHHPDRADVTFLFTLARHDVALARLCAVEALTALDDPQKLTGGDLTPRFVRELVKSGVATERSPLIQHQWHLLEEHLRQGRDRERRRSIEGRNLELRRSPFSFGTPIREARILVGRQPILDQLAALFRKGTRSAVLCGARRMGKTSILYSIEDGALGPGYLPVYFDLQSVAGDPPGEFLRKLVDRLAQRLEEEHVQPPPQVPQAPSLTPGDFTDYVSKVLRSLNDRLLVLLIDEYEGLDRYLLEASFAARFEHVIASEERLFIILAGTKKLEALRNSALENVVDTARYIKVSYLDEPAGRELIAKPFGGAGRFDDDVLDTLFSLTGGHPFYTHALCQHLFERTSADERITRAHVDDAVRAFLKEPPPHLVGTWNNLAEEQELVGVVLAEQGPAGTEYHSAQTILNWLDANHFPASMSKGQVEAALRGMADDDIIDKHVESAEYRFRPELVLRWIRANRSLTELAHTYRERILARVASVWRQWAAFTIDFVATALVLILSGLFAEGMKSTVLPFVIALVNALALILVPMAAARSTVGLRAMGLQAFGWNARPLSRPRAFGYGFLILVRLSLGGTFITLLMIHKGSALAVLAVIVADLTSWIWSERHRGLMERLAGSLLLRVEHR